MKRLIALALAALISAPAFAAGNAESGKEKSKVCAACHGADGNNSPMGPEFPRLAGQHYDYLLKTLKHYKTGERKNPIMGGQVTNLSDQDMADLAAYFSSQKGQLHVIR